MIHKTISYTEARATLSDCLKEVINNCVPIVITRRGNKNAVLISEEEYSGLLETNYLLQSPANAERLLLAQQNMQQGIAGELTNEDLANLCKS